MTTITTRSGKGSPLTNDEVDANFTNLNSDKVETSGDSMTGNLSFGDSNKAIFGAGSDLAIYHDGTNSYVSDQGTGYLSIGTNGSKVMINKSPFEYMAEFITDGAVNLYHNNAQKFATTSTGIDVTGSVTADSLDVNGTATVDAITAGVAADFTFTGPLNNDLIINTRPNSAGEGLLIQQNGTLSAAFANGGDISFYNSAGTSQDLYWDASTSRLGLGTTLPSHELHLLAESPQLRLQDSQGSNTYGDMQFNGTALALITRGGASSHGVMRFRSTNGTDTLDRLEILSNGDVVFYDDAGASGGRWDASAKSLGIGTVSPAVALDVHDSGDATIRILSTGTGVSDDTILRSQISGTLASNYLYFGDADDNNSGQIRYVHSDDSMRFSAGNTTDRLRLYSTDTIFYNGTTEIGRFNSSNNFAIGTPSPACKLHVYTASGNNIVRSESGDNYAAFQTVASGTNSGYIFFNNASGETGRITSANGGTMVFSNNGTQERMRIDSSGNVGIGTATLTDSYKTIIEGSDQETPNLTDSGTHGATLFLRATGEGVGSGGAVAFGTTFGNQRPFAAIKGYVTDGTANSLGDLTFSTRATTSATALTERMRLTQSGRLGLGTNNPAAKFHSVADAQYGEAARFQNNGDAISWARADWVNDQASGSGIVYRDQAGTFTFRNDNSSGTAMTTQILAGATTDGNIVLKRNSGSGSAVFQTTSTGDVIFYDDDGVTQGMRWDASTSRLGLGTTSPSYIVDAQSSGDAAIRIRSTGTSASDDALLRLQISGTTASNIIAFGDSSNSFAGEIRYNHNNNNMSFDTNGSEAMRIDSSGNLFIGKTSASFATEGIAFNTPNEMTITRDSGTCVFLRRNTANGAVQTFYRDTSVVGSISVTTTNTAYNTSSDQRLKDNIVDAPSASDDIDAIQVRSFDWKVDGSHQKYGMVAQELQTVAPDAVSEGDTEEDMMGVDYSKLVPMLVKEIQSLRARVAQLEND